MLACEVDITSEFLPTLLYKASEGSFGAPQDVLNTRGFPSLTDAS